MDKDIREFVEAIGAIEPQPSDKNYHLFRTIFKRSNYFLLSGKFLVIKVSRSKRPFWGVGRNHIDLLNNFENYFLVLLVSSKEGWVFSKKEINANIANGTWRIREKDNNYKINWPLPDTNSFCSPSNFLKKLGITDA